MQRPPPCSREVVGKRLARPPGIRLDLRQSSEKCRRYRCGQSKRRWHVVPKVPNAIIASLRFRGRDEGMCTRHAVCGLAKRHSTASLSASSGLSAPETERDKANYCALSEQQRHSHDAIAPVCDEGRPDKLCAE